MSIKYKNLKQVDAKEYIIRNHGFLIKHPTIYYCNLYECDNNSLILENKIEKKYTLYFDRKRYYEGIAKVSRKRQEWPLSKYQVEIENIEKYKGQILQNLFNELHIVKPLELKDLDLKQFDEKIKNYGYEKAYYNLLLNLIIFSGEYIREFRGGKWQAIENKGRPGEIEPIYIDKEGKEYGFWINTLLVRQYSENELISVMDILEGALLPDIFNVHDNPTNSATE